MEELKEVWNRLQLNEEECEQIEINLERNEKMHKKENRSLIGKVMTDRIIWKEIIQNNTLEKI